MKKGFIEFLIITSLFGCAAPSIVNDQAKAVMGDGPCYNLFVGNQMGSYQHCTHQAFPRCAFALALGEGATQACGAAFKWEMIEGACLIDCWATPAQLQALALSRCEQKREKAGIKEPCRIFAINNEVVWGVKLNEAPDFK